MKRKQSIAWIDVNQHSRSYDLHEYMRIVADARYVFRTVQRIIDECARGYGVEPLEYQALLQIFGAVEQRLPIGRLAERLNIVSALASRLVQQLEARGLVARTRSQKDRRATYVSATKKGENLLRSAFDDVHDEVNYFRLKVTDEQRQAAHEIASFYVGSIDPDDAPRKSPRPLRPAKRATAAATRRRV